MTEEEKMLAGELYDPSDRELEKKRLTAHRFCRQINALAEDDPQRGGLLSLLFGSIGEGTYITGPLQVDYGEFTHFGARCFVNFNLTILDTCPVTIGNDVFIGPNCSFLTPLHPLLPEERKLRCRADGSYYDLEYGAPITVGDGCWIAADVKILGGVTIGAGTTIGAGSVVTRDVPAGVIAAGNPCRVLRKITEADSIPGAKRL